MEMLQPSSQAWGYRRARGLRMAPESSLGAFCKVSQGPTPRSSGAAGFPPEGGLAGRKSRAFHQSSQNEFKS